MATWNFLVDAGLQEQRFTPMNKFTPAPYLQDMKNITKKAPVKKQEPEYKKWGLESQEEFDLMKAVKTQWGSAEDFTFVLEDFRAKYETGKVQPVESLQEDNQILESTVQWGENFIWGAVSNVPNIIWNTFGFLADVVTPKEYEGLWDFFRESWVRDKESLQEVLWVDPDAFTTKVWEFGSEIATLFIPWGQAKLAAKFPQATDKIADIAKAVDNLWENSPKVYNAIKWIVQSSTKWATEVGKFEAVSEWEVTSWDLALWAVANPLIQGVGAGVKGIINKFGWARTVEEVAGNILQPTWKYGALNFESAKEGLKKAMIKLGKDEINGVKDYKSLSSTLKKEQDILFTPLKEGLEKTTGTFKDDSVTDALVWLSEILSKQPWKKFKALSSEVDTLLKKNAEQGLSLPEIQRLKILHTQNNRLFTETGKETSWVSSEALREVRKDLKLLIEKEAAEQWFDDVARINSEYANLLDAQGLIETQINRLTNYLWREGKQTFLQNVAEFVTELPWVKQAITQPMQTVFGRVFKTLRAWKINPIEVEKQLPSLIKELRAAGVPEEAIEQTLQNIVKTVSLIWANEAKDLITND